jgi:hypothetical protein
MPRTQVIPASPRLVKSLMALQVPLPASKLSIVEKNILADAVGQKA